MSDNMRLLIWIVVALALVYFATLISSRYLFSNYNANPRVFGRIAIAVTDMGDLCGEEARIRNVSVEYKLTQSGQIIFLCPLGWFPIQKRIIAETITDAFRNSLTPAELTEVNKFYPPAQKQEAPTTAEPTATAPVTTSITPVETTSTAPTTTPTVTAPVTTQTIPSTTAPVSTPETSTAPAMPTSPASAPPEKAPASPSPFPGIQ